MIFVHPSDVERFALRLLLLYRKGIDSFKSLRTVNSIECPTFKEACLQLGYMKDDNESSTCLEEACNISTGSQMRDLFVLILLNCTPSNPRKLWDDYKKFMTEDILYADKHLHNNYELDFNESHFNIALNKINDSLQKSGHHINNYSDMPTLQRYEIQYTLPSIILDELNYKIESLNKILYEGVPQLNKQQKNIYETIINRTKNITQLGGNAFFIDGPGGTGKIY